MLEQSAFIIGNRSNSEPPASEFLLDHYLLHRQECRCTRCNSTTVASEVFEVQTHPTREIRRLVPAREIKPGYAVALATLECRTAPACFACFDTLPQDQRGHVFASEAEWRATIARKQHETLAPRREAAAQRPQKIEPTLDEL